MRKIILITILIASNFFIGCGNAAEKNQAAKKLELAKQGNVDAQYDLGLDYLYGENGQRVDLKKSAFWFKEAADRGDAFAQNNLAVAYLNGQGVIKDLDQAEKYYTLAAKQNHPNGQLQLALILLNKDKNTNKNQAIYLLERAATQDNNDAQYYLGSILIEENDESHRVKGVEWLRQAEKAGDIRASAELENYFKSNSQQ